MKRLIFLFAVTISLISCAQKVEDVITTPDGKVITDSKDINPYNLEETVKKFYQNINDASKLDKLMSFRFYQKIPYNKFKEIISEKSKKFGNATNINELNSEFSPDKKAVKYTFNIEYDKTKTQEILVLIKENENDNFKIFEYAYQEIK